MDSSSRFPFLKARKKTRIELQRRFDIDIRDRDRNRLFIDLMKREAGTAGADRNVVLNADATEPTNSSDWRNLQILVERCLPDISNALRSPDRTPLIVHPDLLVRYDQMHLLSGIISDIGRVNGIHGLWLVVPANHADSQPVLNQKAIPITNPAQHIRLNRALLANKHRALPLSNPTPKRPRSWTRLLLANPASATLPSKSVHPGPPSLDAAIPAQPSPKVYPHSGN